jgi:hypothetical protein
MENIKQYVHANKERFIHELIELLKCDGLQNISEAVGVNYVQ